MKPFYEDVDEDSKTPRTPGETPEDGELLEEDYEDEKEIEEEITLKKNN